LIIPPILLTEGKWLLKSSSSTQFQLIQEGSSQRSYTFAISDAYDKEEFFSHLKEIIGDVRTHGIAIQRQTLPFGNNQNLELSVWDFGGQHDYYNNHHNFLSTRSVFLVVWNAAEGMGKSGSDGIPGLEFWLNSLRAHLPPPKEGGVRPHYSIIVVGTHLDQIHLPDQRRPLTEKKLKEVFYGTCQLPQAIPFEYIEISTKTGENMDQLRESIIKAALTHAYMGEEIPSDYLKIERLIVNDLRKEFKSLPLIALKKDNKEKQQQQQQQQQGGLDDGSFLLPRIKSSVSADITDEEALRAISLLHSWGVCTHFASSPFLSKYVVLDPTFLTQDILSALFSPGFASYFPNGNLKHDDLQVVWEKYVDKAEFLLGLLEQFEVCFELDPQSSSDFWERESIITAYLPENLDTKVLNDESWPKDVPSDTHQLSRLYSFNVIPKELISRLLVRLHKQMEEKALWRTGLFLESQGVKILIRASISENQLEIFIRGADSAIAKGLINTIHNEVDSVSTYYAGIKKPLSHKDQEKGGGGSVADRWWGFKPTSQWESRGTSTAISAESAAEIKIFQFIQETKGKPGGQVILDQRLYDKLKFVLKQMEDEESKGSINKVTEAFAIYNPIGLQALELKRIELGKKHVTKPDLWNKETWKQKPEDKKIVSKDEVDWPDKHLRQEMIDRFEEYTTRFPWNQEETKTVKVILMAQGTTASWDIAEGGFGVVATLDKGYYGKGTYFTSNLRYAAGYASLGDKSKKPSLLIAATVPGNPFPVTEHPYNSKPSFLGSACQAGYQSHWTIVDLPTFPNCYPMQSNIKSNRGVDELVLFESAQAVPIFIVRFGDLASSGLVPKPSSVSVPPPISAASAPPPISTASAPPPISTTSASNVDDWETDQVVEWLNSVKLAKVAGIAKAEGWDGNTLVGLNDSRDKEIFHVECKEMGVDQLSMRMSFKGALKKLLG